MMMGYPGYWKGYYFDYNPQTQQIVTINLTFVQLNLKQVNNGQIQGKAKDEEGEIQIQGEVEGQTVSFSKTNHKQTLYFKGKREPDHNTVKGWWAKDAADLQDDEQGNGNFILEYIQPRPGWNGFFTQNEVEYQMKFTDLKIEIQPNGKIIGHGSDRKGGQFKIEGSYDHLNKTVKFQKIYQNGNDFFYWGVLSNKEILGHWGMYQNDPQSTFRLAFLQ